VQEIEVRSNRMNLKTLMEAKEDYHSRKLLEAIMGVG
jgi:hypothetical protein